MKVRSVFFASVSSAFLVACAAAIGPSFASSPNAGNDLSVQAHKALSAGKPEVAIRDYSKAIESRTLEPETLANALLNRALAHQQMAAHQLAIDDYTAALQLDAMSGSLRATALYNRGLSYQRAGNLPLAVEDFTSALFLNPTFSHAYFNRANALRESGQLLFALSDYERAARHKHPNMARVHYSAALTYASLRRPAEASKSYQLALELNPNMVEARDGLAKLGNAETNVDVAAGDEILTSSIASLGTGMVVIKPDLPKAVQPPESFDAELTVANVTPVTTTKEFTDRVPTAEAQDVAAGEQAAAAIDDETIVAIEEVPEIPPAKMAVAKPEKQPETEVAVAPVTEVADQATDAPVNGWAVQLASAASENAAWSTWKKMQKKRSSLGRLKPVVVRADLGKKGVFYRVRLVGFDDQKNAETACNKLKGTGVSCYISKASS